MGQHSYEKVSEGGEEQTPFLDSTFEPNHPHSPALDTQEEKAANKFRWKVTILMYLIIIAVDLPSVMHHASQIRIFETIICEQYYRNHDPTKFTPDGTIPEAMCKIEPVQAEMSSIRGWASFFGHLPGLFLAIPFGMLADKYGRKWIFVMNIVAMQGKATWQYVVCAFPHVFPLRMIWLDSISSLFGGGSMVATALIFTCMSDVTPPSAMASTFFRLGAANMLCFTLAPPLAAYLMRNDPWIPFTVGVLFQAIAIPIAMFLPETLGAKRPGEPIAPVKPPQAKTPVADMFERRDFRGISSRVKHFIMENVRLLSKDWRVLFFTCTYPIRMVTGALDGQFLQYIPQRFHWTIAQTTYLQSMQAACGMTTLLLLLPAVSGYLIKKRGWSANRKDILIIRYGFFCYAVGMTIKGFAPVVGLFIFGMVIATTAAGTGAAVRAILTSWIAQNEVARLYSALGIVETIGSIMGGPLVSILYNAGLSAYTHGKSEFLLGLPWMIAGSVMFTLAITTALLRFTNADEKTADAEDAHYTQANDDGFEASDLAPTIGLPPLQTPTIPLTPLTPYTPHRVLHTPRTPRTPYRLSEKYL